MQYYAESHALIYVVDSADRDRIPESKSAFGKLISFLFVLNIFIVYNLADKMISSNFLEGVPLLVLANKQDIPDCMGVRDVKPIFNRSAHLIGRRDCMVMPVSALTGYKTDKTPINLILTLFNFVIHPVMVYMKASIGW